MSPSPAPAAASATAETDDTVFEKRVQAMRAAFDAAPSTYGGVAGTPEFASISSELREISNKARDLHLRANAALLLGALHQERGQWAEAAGSYRRAASLLTDEAGPHLALALALAQTKDFAAAASAQARTVALDPDNLEHYLLLGELHLRAGDKDASAKAYADYETRRRELIDGLTLRRDGAYVIGVEDRIACAEYLAPSADVGTAFALLYALQEEPEPRVRTAIVDAMGTQRLLGYKPRLEARLEAEPDPEVRKAITWALGEIAAAPVDTKLEGAAPVPTPSGGEPGPKRPKAATDATPAPAGGSDRAADAPAASASDPVSADEPALGADASVGSSASAP